MPASRRKSWSASVVVSTGWTAAGWGGGAGSFSSGSSAHELDPPAVELRVHGLELERIELQRLEQFDELLLTQLPARLGGLEQRREFLVDEDGLDLDGQSAPPDVIRVCLT